MCKYRNLIVVLNLFLPSTLHAQSEPLHGVILTSRQQSITSTNAGRLISLVKNGTNVKQGELIAEIDSENEQIELQLLKSKSLYLEKEFEKSQLLLAAEKKRYERSQSLYKSAALSENDIGESLLKLNMASLDAQILKAKLYENKTEMNLKKNLIQAKRLVAPFPGVVEYVDNQIDSYLVPGRKIATLLSTNRIVRFLVNPDNISAWKIGDQLKINVSANEELFANVNYIGHSIDETTSSVLVEAAIASPLPLNKHLLISGIEVKVYRQ